MQTSGPSSSLPLLLPAALVLAAAIGLFIRYQLPSPEMEIHILPETVLEVPAPAWETESHNE